MAATKHHVILLPGLGDRTGNVKLATNWWKSQGLVPHVLRLGWRDKGADLRNMLDRVIARAEELDAEGTVSVVGTSAGGSAAFNLLSERPDLFATAVNVCGRLRSGQHRIRSLDHMAVTSIPFRESVLLFEAREAGLPSELLGRMMSVRARFGDECVPGATNVLAGAPSMIVPVFGHSIAITLSLTFFAGPLLRFMKQGKP